jgi:hypothetical protein
MGADRAERDPDLRPIVFPAIAAILSFTRED